MFPNEHDVIATSLDASNTIKGLDTLTTPDAVTLTEVRVSVAKEREKREYPSKDSDEVNLMEDIEKREPLQRKRELVNEDDEPNGLVSTLSLSG